MDEEYFARLVDQESLRGYLEEAVGPADSFSVERHAEGHSNETLFVEWGDRDLVVRRPPPGETAETAHDVLREYRVLDALQGTAVAVPRTVAACEDHDVIGSDFYVMERVPGVVLRESEPERFAEPAAREAIGRELVDGIADVHEVDVDAVGLADFGRPKGYTGRQVERWREQLSWAFEVTSEERTVPALDRVGEWLAENVPEDHPHALVHGDYKLDNLLFESAPVDGPGTGRVADGSRNDRPTDGPQNGRAPDGPRTDRPADGPRNGRTTDGREAGTPELVAVLDWEMATLGDPRADLGWLLSYWRDPGDPEPSVPELTATFMEREGYPTRRDLLARYEARTGIEYAHDRFYRTLAVYKLAALGEMFYRRHLEGNADDPMYPAMDERVPALAARAERIVDGDEPL